MSIMKLQYFLLLAFLLCGCYRNLQLNALSDPNITASAYTDKLEDNGNSEISNFSYDTSGTTVNFTLRNGFKYPYAGIIFKPKESHCDLSFYDSLFLEIHSPTSQRVRFYVKTIGNYFDKTIQKERYKRVFIDINPGKNEITLALKDLIEPNWWLRDTKTTLSTLPTEEFQEVASFGVSTTTIHRNDSTYQFSIKKLYFKQKGTEKAMTVQLTIIYIIGFITFFIIYRRSHPKTEKRVRNTGHLPITHDELDLIESIIKENLNHESLSSVDIAQLTGLDIKMVISTIKDHYGVSVVQHINSLRIAKAKELLHENELSFEEIALRCGYSQSTHFKQLFISITGESPATYKSRVL